MAKKRSGACFICDKTYTGSGIGRHLKSCRAKHPIGLDYGGKKGKTVTRKIYHIEVIGRYWNDYWMHLEVSSNNTLLDLDLFLRKIWLECCGHLSSFRIGNTTYVDEPESYGWDSEEDIYIALNKLPLYEGLAFTYQYDFGSTTELWLKIHKIEEVEIKGKTLYVIARNDTITAECQTVSCTNPATEICPMCICESEGLLCQECAEDHECGEEMLLPIVNSPRVGECGYCGPDLVGIEPKRP